MAAKPAPRVVSEVCSLCGLDWQPRVSTERRAALNVLRTHAAMLRAGRIDRAEWFRRVDRVYQARFLGDHALPPSRPGARP